MQSKTYHSKATNETVRETDNGWMCSNPEHRVYKTVDGFVRHLIDVHGVYLRDTSERRATAETSAVVWNTRRKPS